MPGKKNLRCYYIREKNRACKVQIVLKKILAEVKCIKKSCRDMRLKKKLCRKNFITPLPGFLMVPPLIKKHKVCRLRQCLEVQPGRSLPLNASRYQLSDDRSLIKSVELKAQLKGVVERASQLNLAVPFLLYI